GRGGARRGVVPPPAPSLYARAAALGATLALLPDRECAGTARRNPRRCPIAQGAHSWLHFRGALRACRAALPAKLSPARREIGRSLGCLLGSPPAGGDAGAE